MRTFWQAISILSHPLIIVTYGLVCMLAANPFLFGASTLKGHLPFLMIVAFSTFVIPGLAVVLMRRLNMISSFTMEDRKERVGPIFATCILYAAFYFNVERSNAMPAEFGNFLLGALISLFCCLFINSFYKISLHAVGMSGLVLGMFIYYFSGSAESIEMNMGSQTMSIHFVLVPLLLLVCLGMVSTGRVLLNAHQLDQVLAGWLVGVLGQVVANII